MIEIKKEDSTIKISFQKPEFDIGDVKELEGIVTSLINQSYVKLIFDFQTVKFINSTTMGQIAKLIQDAKNKNAKIFFNGEIDPFVYQLFSISGLEEYLNNREDD
ncbi:MAG: STAS domain-containing protein [Leptospiraceae bacterium]|nr:STAS domain-containing protein [Leptospiraceae bacterium]MCK6380882.1 STAS domain-containing protein [Leptospiraceae bacterium]NUM42391.1 STAS domain-containing protein [Leptospiraceae bacterium]